LPLTEARLRAIIRSFYDAVFDDIMIGFFFKKADKERLIRLEYELISPVLGVAQPEYTGQPLDEVHARHRIFGGQFERRMQLLREAFETHDLSPELRDAWLAHAESLRSQITTDAGSECDA